MVHVDYTEKQGLETSPKFKITRVALVGACKWSQNLVGTHILHDLKHKVSRLSQVAHGQEVIYYLFARSGFTADLKVLAEQEGVHLVSLADGAFAV